MHQAPYQPRSTSAGGAAASIRVRHRKLSMNTQLSQSRLDEELAAGVRPDTDPLLRERTRNLVSRESRLEMADGLDRILDLAGRRPVPHTALAPVRTEAVRRAAPTLEMLARRLRDSLPIGPQGAAKTRILLTDSRGPLYNPARERDLTRAARRALAGFDTDSGRHQSKLRKAGGRGW